VFLWSPGIGFSAGRNIPPHAPGLPFSGNLHAQPQYIGLNGVARRLLQAGEIKDASLALPSSRCKAASSRSAGK
jgi:hypothetical protein